MRTKNDKKPLIGKKEWRTVGIIAAVVLLLSQLPLIVGHLTEGEGEVFMGIPVHVTDANNHLNWVLQAKEGHVLFANEFTPEDMPALIFNPFHLVVGNAARLFHAPVTATYNLFGMLIILGFIFTLYLFISHFVKEKRTRMLAFILALTSAGFGLWWKISKLLLDKWVVSSDLWVTEMNTFQSFGHPHFTLSATLLLLTFHFAVRSIDEDDMRLGVYAGLLSLLLATIHLFDTITMAFVLAGWFAYRQLAAKKWSWKEFSKLAVIGAITVPAVAYYFWVFFMNPAYKEWNSLNQTVTPGPLALISGFGFLFLLALAYIIDKRKEYFKKASPVHFLTVWAVLNLILVYLPINVQRRFLLGMHIPLSILSALVIADVIAPYLHRKLHLERMMTYTLIVLLCAATTVYLLATQIQGLHEAGTTEYGNTKYLTTQEYEALRWIDAHTENSDVIVAPYHLSNYIPAVTGNKVYCGHWAQTVDFEKKCAEVTAFYAGEGTLPEAYYYIDLETYAVEHVKD